MNWRYFREYGEWFLYIQIYRRAFRFSSVGFMMFKIDPKKVDE